MRRLRICYFTALAVVLFAARLTGRREFFLLLFMMTFVVIYSIALNLWTILSFSYIQEISERTAVKGRTLRLKIGIYNGKPFPFTMMRMRVETALPSEKLVLGFNLSPESHIYYDLPLHCGYRGVYKVGMTTLEVNDIFGLIRINFDMRKLPYYRQRELTVLPRLSVLPFLPARIRDAKLAGGGAPILASSGDSYFGLRQYHPGDSLGRIHWPVSVRAQDLFVKQYDRPAESSVLVALDNSALFEGEDALRYADIACECAAAVAHYSLRMGFTVRVVDAGAEQPAIEVRSHQEFTRFYEGLANLDFGGSGGLAGNIRRQADAGGAPRAVYALTSRQDETLCRTLTGLARAGIEVKCFLLYPSGSGAELYDPGMMPGVSCHSLSFGDDITFALSREDAP